MPSSSTPIHGNYHGYYTKRPTPLSDPRLSRLPPGLFQDAVVLDVGCNEGWVTCEIAQSYGASKVVGVDIDETLIQGAWKRRRTLWSLQEPLHHLEEGESERDSGKKRRRKGAREEGQPEQPKPRPNYFPLSFEHEFGPLPIPPHELQHDAKISNKAPSFPHNVVFRCTGWASETLDPKEEGTYDVVLAFSLTKWIHLNAGDAGLLTFFRKVYNALRKGGTFVLEPQPWESYSKAKRMDETLKATYQTLTLRPSTDFERVLREIGFGPVKHAREPGQDSDTGVGGWDRPIDLYVKL